MIIELWEIFRARRQPKVAARLAAKMAQGQLLDRVGAPLFLVHLVLLGLFGLCLVLLIGALIAGLSLHWSAALPGLLPLFVGGAALTGHIGLRRGMAKICDLAETITDAGLDRVLPISSEDAQPAAAPNDTDITSDSPDTPDISQPLRQPPPSEPTM